MAYVTIPNTIIESGDPVTQELWSTYVKNDLDNHETRIVSLEGGANVAYIPLMWAVNGYLGLVEDCGVIRIPFDITLLAARLLIQNAGSGSSTEIDIKYKRGSSSWTSIFSTKPSVSSTSDYSLSSNANLSTTSILSGDLLRMSITAFQSGDPKGLVGILEFEKT